jgi:2-iminobutanoate/2-iminopropanoate deaminase
MPLRKRIKASNIPEHKMPFPAAVRIGNILFSSALGGDDPETHELPEDKEAQISNVFQTIRNVLDAAGASPANIGKVTIYVADREDRKLINPHWLEMFPDEDDRPVRHTAAAAMPKGRHIQIEFIAVL